MGNLCERNQSPAVNNSSLQFTNQKLNQSGFANQILDDLQQNGNRYIYTQHNEKLLDELYIHSENQAPTENRRSYILGEIQGQSRRQSQLSQLGLFEGLLISALNTKDLDVLNKRVITINSLFDNGEEDTSNISINQVIKLINSFSSSQAFKQQPVDFYRASYIELLKMLNNLIEEEVFLQQFKDKLEFIFVLIQNSRYSSQTDEDIYSKTLSYINRLYDFSNINCVMELIGLGFIGVLFEALFKQFTFKTKRDTLLILRNAFQTEFIHGGKWRNEDTYEVQRLFKLLPESMYDLLTSDQDEDNIMNGLEADWSTPTLIWTKQMRNETLLHLSLYNNRNISRIKQLLLVELDVQKLYSNHMILQPIYFTEDENEPKLCDIYLKEFNRTPNFPIPIELYNLIFELSIAIEALIIKYNQIIDEPPSEEQDRISCETLVYLTSFMLALEQYLLNEQHPQLESDINKNQSLMKQRDRISDAVLLRVKGWMYLQKNWHEHIKSIIIQSLYLITYSDLATVKLQPDLLDNLLNLLIKREHYELTQADQNLISVTILRIVEKQYVRSNISQSQADELLQLFFQEHIECLGMAIKILREDPITKDFIDKQNIFDQNKLDHIILPNCQWRIDYNELSIGVEDNQDFPKISPFSVQSLPHPSQSQLIIIKEKKELLEDLQAVFNLSNFEDYSQITPQNGSLIFGEGLAQGQNDKQEAKRKYSMISNDDIFT